MTDTEPRGTKIDFEALLPHPLPINASDLTELRAYACLIAAAPDLLAALKAICEPPKEYAATQAYRDRIKAVRAMAHAAIAKAEGRTE